VATKNQSLRAGRRCNGRKEQFAPYVHELVVQWPLRTRVFMLAAVQWPQRTECSICEQGGEVPKGAGQVGHFMGCSGLKELGAL